MRARTLAQGAKGREDGCTTSAPLLCSRTKYRESRQLGHSIGTKVGTAMGIVSWSSTVYYDCVHVQVSKFVCVVVGVRVPVTHSCYWWERRSSDLDGDAFI